MKLPEHDLLLVREVCAAVRLNRHGVVALIKSGGLPGSFRTAGDRGTWRVPREAVVAWGKRGTRPA